MFVPAIVYASDHNPSVLSIHQWRTISNSLPYIKPYLASSPSLKILDVGCGPGSITVDLAKHVPEGHVTGVEYTPEPLAQARAFRGVPGSSERGFRGRGYPQAGVSRWQLRPGSRTPGAPACGGSGAGASGDAPGDEEGRLRVCARVCAEAVVPAVEGAIEVERARVCCEEGQGK